ncbi:MAG TPA: cyclic nucleotide-binding domain-containing protein [bacterium]|nr:cyclic nucleotide-binding domain-containing protein [bacterium]
MEERIKILEKCELFRRLPPEALAAAAARCEEGEAKEGDVILVEGKPTDAVYVLADGKVDYIKQVDEKRGLVISRWQAGAVFGLSSVMDGQEQYVSAVATTPVKYLKLPVVDFWAVCAEDPRYEHGIYWQTLLIQSVALRQVTLRLREFLAKMIK